MNTRWMVPWVAVLAAGCGGGGADGMTVEGTVAVTVHQAGQADGSTGFNFADAYTVDTPPATGHGFQGTCVRSGSQWTFTLSRETSAAAGLDGITVVTGTGTAPTVSLVIGSSTFGGGGTCQATATPEGSSDVHLTAQCTGLTSGSDPRTVDANLQLALGGCTGG